MRRLKIHLIGIGIVLAIASMAWATATNYVPGTSYGRQTTSVNSSSTPVNVMPALTGAAGAALRGSYRICANSQCAQGLICGEYTGSLPGSAGTNWEEIPSGQCRVDSGTDATPVQPSTLNLAWGCVLETGSSACNAYATWR